MTKFIDFFKEIVEEAKKEGKQAMKELENFQTFFRSEVEKEHCLIEAFFEHQKTLPPSRRSNSCMISCPCSRCTPRM